MAGMEPRYQEWEGDAPERFVVDQNLHRRHLTLGQRAALALKLAKQFAGAAQERMEAGINQYSPTAKLP